MLILPRTIGINVENPKMGNKQTMYQKHIGRTVRVVCGGYTHIGILEEANFDGLLLHPALVNQSTHIQAKYAYGSENFAIAPFCDVHGFEVLNDNFIEEYLADAKRANELKLREFELREGQLERALHEEKAKADAVSSPDKYNCVVRNHLKLRISDTIPFYGLGSYIGRNMNNKNKRDMPENQAFLENIKVTMPLLILYNLLWAEIISRLFKL